MPKIKGLLKKLKPEQPKKKTAFTDVERDIDPSTIWDIINELGDGAYGKVYKTRKKNSDLFAALKRVEFDTEDELDDFMVEIDILMHFKHKNILSLHEVYIFDNKLWMYLELCGGGALDSIMNTLEKPLSETQIRFVAREVLCGLSFLHENLIIHRDMKAGNILLTSNNEVKLADFGVSAKLASEKQKRGTFIGSPYWMAPEVIACETFKDNPYNWKADIWSFGITLIELAQMRPPNNDINPVRVTLKIAKSDPPTLTRPARWSAEFNQFLGRCLQKDPNQRPECKELLNDPFVRNVSENDRKQIRILLCELKADVIDTMEDVDPDEMQIDEIEASDQDALILPDSTKITMPIEIVVDEEDEDELDQHGQKKPIPYPRSSPSRKSNDSDSGIGLSKIPHPANAQPDRHTLVSHLDTDLSTSVVVPKSGENKSPHQQHHGLSVVAVARSRSLKQTEIAKSCVLKRRATVAHTHSNSKGSWFTLSTSQSSDPSKLCAPVTRTTESTEKVLTNRSFKITQPFHTIQRSNTINLANLAPGKSKYMWRTEITIPISPLIRHKSNHFPGKYMTTTTSVASPKSSEIMLMHQILEETVEQIVQDVLSSETRHPSVPACIYEIMRDLSMELESEAANMLEPNSSLGRNQIKSNRNELLRPSDFVNERKADKLSPEKSKPPPILKPKPNLVDIPLNSTQKPNNGQLRKQIPLKRQNSAYRTMTRTRRFVVDGKEVTTTSKHIVRPDFKGHKLQEDELNKRRAAVRAFRMIAKQEARRVRELDERARQQNDLLQDKLTAEFMALNRNYEQKLEAVARNFKTQLERLEKDREMHTKRIRSENAKAERSFKNHLRSEIVTLKRTERKAAMKELKADQNSWSSANSSVTSLNSTTSSNASSNSEVGKRLTEFREDQESRMRSQLYEVMNDYNERLQNLKRDNLAERQAIRMNFEQEKWRMDERHLRMRHLLDVSRIKDSFIIKRQQLALRSEWETNELRQIVLAEREKLSTIHSIERKNLIKALKATNRQSTLHFQRQIRSNSTWLSGSNSDQLNKIENGSKRLEEELAQLDIRQRNQTEALEASIIQRFNELEQSQAEKRNALVDQETLMLEELNEKHQNDLRAYVKTVPRIKAILQEQFAQEMSDLKHNRLASSYANLYGVQQSRSKSSSRVGINSMVMPRSPSISNPLIEFRENSLPSGRIQTLFPSSSNGSVTSSATRLRGSK